MIDFDSLTAGPVLDAFAESVSYQQAQAGVTSSVRGVFMRPAQVEEVGDDGRMHWTTSAPRITLRASEIGFAPAQNDCITRSNAERYRVVDIRPDGVALVVLTLKVC